MLVPDGHTCGHAKKRQQQYLSVISVSIESETEVYVEDTA